MGPESDVRMPLTAHLEELRTRLIRMIAALTVAAVLSWLVIEHLVDFLLAPLQQLRPEESLIIGTGVTEAFFTKLKVSLIASVFLASPVIFFQLWAFIAPGLYENEKSYARPFVFFATFFFVLGATFCFYAVFPVAFTFFVDEFQSIGVEPTLRISEYLAFSSRMLLAFGAIFEMPVFAYFLARIGAIDHTMMIGWFRYAIVVIFVVAAILTPADAASQFLMAVPMTILYGLSIGVAYLVRRDRKADDEER